MDHKLWLPVLADRSTFELAVTADNKIGDNFIFVSCEIRLSDRLIFFSFTDIRDGEDDYAAG